MIAQDVEEDIAELSVDEMSSEDEVEEIVSSDKQALKSYDFKAHEGRFSEEYSY